MTSVLIRHLRLFVASALGALMWASPARADDVLFTFGELVHLQGLPLESARRAMTEEEIVLYQNFEFYAYTVFESLQVANEAATLIKQPLFCAPDAIFHFRQEGDVARLADYVIQELFELTKEIGGPLDRYDGKPASAVLLLGLRASFPCSEPSSQLAQR